jgi:hypothetical protein
MSLQLGPHPALVDARRFGVTRERDLSIAAWEITLLLGLGAAAALLAGFLHWRLPMPGHAILRAFLPLAAGLALIPRRGAGTIMAGGGLAASTALMGLGVGHVQPPALVGALVLGPLLDWTLRSASRGWSIYLRMILCGMAANLLAFAARFTSALAGWDPVTSRPFVEFWPTALFSFLLCGALAGLLCALICFRGGKPSGEST